MKKLFLLAMLAVFQLSALKAQGPEPIVVNSWATDYNLKVEVYRVGRKLFKKHIFPNGDYCVEAIEVSESQTGPKVGRYDIQECADYRFTYPNAVVELRNGTRTITFKNGDVTQSELDSERLRFHLEEGTISSSDLKQARAYETMVFDYGVMVSPEFYNPIRIDSIDVKVGEGKYKKHVKTEVKDLLGGNLKLYDSGDDSFYYDRYDEKTCRLTDKYQRVPIVVGTKKAKVFSKEKQEQSLKEWNDKYGVDFIEEYKSFAEAVFVDFSTIINTYYTEWNIGNGTRAAGERNFMRECVATEDKMFDFLIRYSSLYGDNDFISDAFRSFSSLDDFADIRSNLFEFLQSSYTEEAASLSEDARTDFFKRWFVASGISLSEAVEKMNKQGMYKRRNEEMNTKFTVNGHTNSTDAYIIAKVEAGHGAMVGLEGMTYKDLMKLIKKNKIDLTAVVERYASVLNLISESWDSSVDKDVYKYFFCPVSEKDSVISVRLANGLYNVQYKLGSDIYLKSDSRNEAAIIKGVIKKEDGTVTIDPSAEDPVVFKYNNGDEFVPNGCGINFKDLQLNHLPNIVEGVMYYANGSVEEVKDGYTESQRLAMQQAEEERQRAEEAAVAEAHEKEKEEWRKKYGEHWVNIYEKGDYQNAVGMPEELAKRMFLDVLNCNLINSTNWSDGTVYYDIFQYVLGTRGRIIGSVWFYKGKLSSWRLD